jgi:hypothetical protein
MNTVRYLLPACTALMVGANILATIRLRWKQPLNHGSGYFFSAPVGDGFYKNEGRIWMRRYRIVLTVCHVLELLAAAALLAFLPWERLPILAPVEVGIFLGLLGGFILYARRHVVAEKPRLATAVSLVPRRLGDYVKWSREAAFAVLLAACWIALIVNGRGLDWRTPLILTYVIAGLFVSKILAVTKSAPLPADRPEEHAGWAEAQRRESVRRIDYQRALLAAVVAGYTLKHLLETSEWERWAQAIAIAATLGVWLIMTVASMRSETRLATMGHDLRPQGSWIGPGGTAWPGGRIGLCWGFLFLGGLLALFIVTRQ